MCVVYIIVMADRIKQSEGIRLAAGESVGWI
jgi:hypothetical protein